VAKTWYKKSGANADGMMGTDMENARADNTWTVGWTLRNVLRNGLIGNDDVGDGDNGDNDDDNDDTGK
jgi:hypothetical protein